MSHLFTSGGQRIRVSASTSDLTINTLVKVAVKQRWSGLSWWAWYMSELFYVDNCSEASAWEHMPEETAFLQLLFSFSLWFSSIYSTEPAGQDLEQSVCQSATSPHPVPDSRREGPTQLTWPLPPHCSFKPTQIPQARIMNQHPSQLQARAEVSSSLPLPLVAPGRQRRGTTA